jgi:hypothetical protein
VGRLDLSREREEWRPNTAATGDKRRLRMAATGDTEMGGG